MPIGGIAAELITPLSDNFEPHVAEDAVAALVANATAQFAALVGGNLTVARRTGWLASAAVVPAEGGVVGVVAAGGSGGDGDAAPGDDDADDSRRGNFGVVAAGAMAVASVTTLEGRTTCGRVFVDCSYEGDLLQLSGAEFTLGREAAAQCVRRCGRRRRCRT